MGHSAATGAPGWGGAEGDLARRKQALRERMRAVRAAIEPPERERLGRAVEAALFRLPVLADARTVMLFYSFGPEVPTRPIIERLAREGRRIALPFVHAGEIGAAAYAPGDPLVGTSYGPSEPLERRVVPPQEIDVVVAPGLAFDRAGRRLGYGGGYYDRYLARRPRASARIGIAFARQVVDEVPAGPGDEPVDVVVTENGVLDGVAERGR